MGRMFEKLPEVDPALDEALNKNEWFNNLNRPTPDTKSLLQLHEHLGERGREIMATKNSDYGSTAGDPFRNFAAFGAFGILVRLSDKMARLRTFVETLIDAINYLVLLDGYIRTNGVSTK